MTTRPHSGPEPFYSLSRRAGGFVFLSAFGPVDESMQVVGESIQEQTTACMKAMGAALRAAGADFGDLVCVDVFLADLEDRDGFNEIYAGFFPDRDNMPTRRLYGAGELFKGIRVEVTGIAHVGE